jgi:hypothetical protein
MNQLIFSFAKPTLTETRRLRFIALMHAHMRARKVTYFSRADRITRALSRLSRLGVRYFHTPALVSP